VRRDSKFLVAIGACATAGGIQALRNFGEVKELAEAVYPRPGEISVLDRSTPIADHVAVDFELRGCPINKLQLLEVISAFLQGRKPNVPRYALCLECKLKDALRDGGPWGARRTQTQAGCGALPLWPGCYGVSARGSPSVAQNGGRHRRGSSGQLQAHAQCDCRRFSHGEQSP
jgi:coenzyme F420-reducing hydrogenase gamma subunit